MKFGGEDNLKSEKRMKILKLLFGVAAARLGETFARADHIGMKYLAHKVWIMWYKKYDRVYII